VLGFLLRAKLIVVVLVALLASWLPRDVNAASDPSDASRAEPYIRSAQTMHLERDLTWLRLGHWRANVSGGFTSEADGEAFFLASDGKHDPPAELAATLRAYFVIGPVKGGDDEHALCRFPARLMWLQEKLGIDLSRLPARQCTKLGHYWDRTRPKGATLVFSSYYLNNPASAFGHTFLRINRDDPYAVGGRRELLDYGVDYSAAVTNDNALVYGLKGLTGLYPGRFNIYPYFYKVREYNDYESRDLWEYDLALTPKQVTMLTLHLWELGSTYFAYYYMTENCSYHILGALEVVDPKLKLLDKLKFPVVPIDTVKSLMRSPGLVASVHYRPSMRSQFRRRIEHLDEGSLTMITQLVAQPNAPFTSEVASPTARVHVLDAALDLVDVRYAKDILKGTGSEGAKIKQRLMERRASILVASVDDEGTAPKQRPDQGHGSRRVVLATGLSSADQGSGYYELGYRLALHDLSDAPTGYPELAQIEFLPLRLRMWPGVSGYRALQLEDIALISVLSLTPQNRFDRQISWRVRAGGERLRDAGCNDCFVASVELGGGVAFASVNEAVSVFLMVNNSLLSGPHLDGIANAPIRFGIGPWGGARLRWSQQLVTVATAGVDYLPLQDAKLTWSVKTSTAWMLGQQVGIAVEGRAQPKAAEVQLTSRLYF